MRILYLHQYFHTPSMSGSTRSYEFAKRLVKNGHQVYVISSWRFGGKSELFSYENIDGINVTWISIDYSNRLGFFRRLYAFLKFAILSSFKSLGTDVDIVFATSAPLSIALPGIITSKFKKIPMVFEVRDVWPLVPIEMGVLKSRILIYFSRLLEKYAYRSSKRVIVVAPGMKQEIVKTGYLSENVAIIPHGCDIDLFRKITDKEMVYVKGTINILYLGTIGVANGVDYIVRLAKTIKSKNSDIKFTIIGDGRERNKVEQLAKELGVLNDNLFMLGEMPKNSLVQYVQESDATIMTYTGPEILYRDSVSNKFFDSISAGKPVFANFSGFSSLVADHFEAGFILSSYNYDKASDDLIHTILDPRFKEETTKACNFLVSHYFSRDKLARDFEKVLLDVVSGTSISENIGGEYEKIWNEVYYRHSAGTRIRGV